MSISPLDDVTEFERDKFFFAGALAGEKTQRLWTPVVLDLVEVRLRTKRPGDVLVVQFVKSIYYLFRGLLPLVALMRKLKVREGRGSSRFIQQLCLGECVAGIAMQ